MPNPEMDVDREVYAGLQRFLLAPKFMAGMVPDNETESLELQTNAPTLSKESTLTVNVPVL